MGLGPGGRGADLKGRASKVLRGVTYRGAARGGAGPLAVAGDGMAKRPVGVW